MEGAAKADGDEAEGEEPRSKPSANAKGDDPQREATADENLPGEPAAGDGDDATLVPVSSPPTQPGAAEALIGQLALPNETSLSGTPVPLVDVLSRSPDRRRQIELTHAYWNLSAAVADYETCVIELAGLERLLPAAVDGGRRVADLELEAQLAAAHARQRELELNVITAQYALSDLAGSTNVNPLPSDVPHVGAYLTRAHEIYGARPAPPRVHLIDRVLPLRLNSLDMRANAVHAAQDAADSAEQNYHAAASEATGEGNLAVALTAVAELARQQRAFVAAARDYNHDIAEYSLGIAPQGMTAASLVPLLIGPTNNSPARSTPGGKPQVTQGPGGVKRAGFDAVPDVMSAPSGRRRNEPKLAPPQRGGAKSNVNETRRVVRKAPADGAAAESADGGGEAVGLYSALQDLPPKRRTQKLASLLHWDRALPDSLGVAATLEACLARAVGVDRRTLIETYWRAREHVAGYQLAAQRIEQLDGLVPGAMRAAAEPGGAAAMLRLRRARLAAEADLQAARVELLVSQFALALVGRWPLDGRWPVPSTAPHGGSYRLGVDSGGGLRGNSGGGLRGNSGGGLHGNSDGGLRGNSDGGLRGDAQRPEIAGSPAVQRLTARIPMLHGVLTNRADSIVAVDAARALASSRYESGAAQIDEPLETIDRQSAETMAFLMAQTEYNLEIADFVLSVLPAGTPDQRLIESLVLTPSAESTGR
jgi:hypothetical protein